jgi:hypothetical protein
VLRTGIFLQHVLAWLPLLSTEDHTPLPCKCYAGKLDFFSDFFVASACLQVKFDLLVQAASARDDWRASLAGLNPHGLCKCLIPGMARFKRFRYNRL